MKRTVNTIWFVNLAVADLLCCVSIPFSMAEIILNHHWPYGKAMCKVLPNVIVLNMFARVFTLVLISLDRFALVILPVWAQNHRSLTLAWLLCGLAWVLALLLSLPSMIYRGIVVLGDMNTTLCTYHHLLDETEGNQSAITAIKATHVTRLVLGFLVPWLGLVMEYGGEASEDMAQALEPLAISLAYVNSCLNPLLYVFMGQDFKERARVSLRKIFENVFSKDVTMRSSVYSKGQSAVTVHKLI
ncbi:unnamed protein product [Coregonus sp. 'balchen']|nr:unnamed protein product [Coregonus sp. 'balchen']